MRIKNITNGYRGIATTSGMVMLEPGQVSDDITLADGEDVDESGWFQAFDPLDHDGDGKRGGSKPDDPPSLTNKTKAELIAIAKDEGAEIEGDMTVKDLKSAIELNRGE